MLARLSDASVSYADPGEGKGQGRGQAAGGTVQQRLSGQAEEEERRA